MIFHLKIFFSLVFDIPTTDEPTTLITSLPLDSTLVTSLSTLNSQMSTVQTSYQPTINPTTDLSTLQTTIREAINQTKMNETSSNANPLIVEVGNATTASATSNMISSALVHTHLSTLISSSISMPHTSHRTGKLKAVFSFIDR